MHPVQARTPQASWLVENGPRELELLFQVIVCHRATPILIADNDRYCRQASAGVSKLLGLPREKIIGRKIDDFAEPTFRPRIPDLWRAFLETGEQEGKARLTCPDGSLREVTYTAKGSVLPVRHVVFLHEKAPASATQHAGGTGDDQVPASAEDYALFLMDAEGRILTWYAGAERIYGYTAEQVIGRNLSFLYPSEDNFKGMMQEVLERCSTAGYFASEGWRKKKDGSKFWANGITMALKDENGELRGFAMVVRDFSDRHESDEKLRRSRARIRTIPAESAIAGIVSGEFDHISEANDTFLELVGYSRADLLAGQMRWFELTPPEYAALDELAHEEGLRYGASTPFEKQLIRKDGTRVSVLVATAVLQLAPFRWITFVQDLRERDRRESIEGQEEDVQEYFEGMVGNSAALRRVRQLTEVVAPTDATVLILGETGTGKELVARAIHRTSLRKNRPFVTLNCAAIPTGLLESELFGYEKGAFTGALSQKIGRFEIANGGTLFLDEVGDIPLDLQPKLLRALQERSVERLGGTKTIPIDVRLVAATNRNLTQMMRDKLFRSDLYYRLRVFPITITPLRNRSEDIPVLARYFARKYAATMNRRIDSIPIETMRALVSWPWPGNVRELENFIERSVILSNSTSLRAPLGEIRLEGVSVAGSSTLEQVEREHIVRVFRESGGSVTKAATTLGLHRTTLNSIMHKLGISRHDP